MLALGGPWFEHGIVNADVFAPGIKLREFFVKAFCAPGSSNFFQERRGLRKMFPQRMSQGAGAPDKHSAVPVVVAGGDKLFGPLQIRFFREAIHAEEPGLHAVSGFDVSITGLCARRFNTHDNDVFSLGSNFHATLEHLAKLLFIVDHVIGGKHSNDGIGINSFQQKSSKADGWGGVAGFRLNHDLGWRNVGELALNLFADEFISNDPESFLICGRGQPVYRLLDHGLLAIQGKDLLGQPAPAARPETRSASAGENDWIKAIFRHKTSSWTKRSTPLLRYGSDIFHQHRLRVLNFFTWQGCAKEF